MKCESIVELFVYVVGFWFGLVLNKNRKIYMGGMTGTEIKTTK